MNPDNIMVYKKDMNRFIYEQLVLEKYQRICVFQILSYEVSVIHINW